MAKKRALKLVGGGGEVASVKALRKRRGPKNVPASGQQALPGVESDRDIELDRACDAIAAGKRKKKAAAEEYDDACNKAGEVLRKKDRSSYTGSGVNIALVSEDKVKVTKAKDK